MTVGRTVIQVTTVITVALLSSCGLFTTRTPESPEGANGNGWRFPESPEIVLSNLTSSIGRRSTADYTRLFVTADRVSPGYSFQPDPGSAAAYPGIFDAWSVTREQKHSQSLFAPTNLSLDSLLLVELTIDREKLIGDTADISCGYSMHVGHRIAEKPRDFEGRAEFRLLRLEDGGWYVFTWADTRASGKACWSDLKALF